MSFSVVADRRSNLLFSPPGLFVVFILMKLPYLFGGDGGGPKAVLGCWYITLSIKGIDSAFLKFLFVLLYPSLTDYIMGERLVLVLPPLLVVVY